MYQMFQRWVCLLKADTDSGVGKYQTKEKLLLKPEILSLLQGRTWSSPAGQWQLLVLAVLWHPEWCLSCLSAPCTGCSPCLQWYLSISVAPAGCLPYLSSSFPVPAGRVSPHPFRLCAGTLQQCSRHPAQEHLTLCHLSN